MAVAGRAQKLQLERRPRRGAAGHSPSSWSRRAKTARSTIVASHTAPLTGLTAFCVAISRLKDL
jgi:hypothetical protein